VCQVVRLLLLWSLGSDTRQAGLSIAPGMLYYQVLEPVASKLAADIAADEATPADPTITAMARDRLAPMTFELSGSTGTAHRIWLKVTQEHTQLHVVHMTCRQEGLPRALRESITQQIPSSSHSDAHLL
jgi:hypothetical protein